MAPAALFREPSPLQTFAEEPQQKQASLSLDELIFTLTAENPLATLSCIYCRPGCPGGSSARCHKVATKEATTPSEAHAFAKLMRSEYVEAGKVQDGYYSYLRVLNQHAPYSARLMAAENEKACAAIQQVEIITRRLADLTSLAELASKSEATFVPESVWREAEVTRGWLDHSFGKLVKNHECLKLNFMNDHTLLKNL